MSVNAKTKHEPLSTATIRRFQRIRSEHYTQLIEDHNGLYIRSGHRSLELYGGPPWLTTNLSYGTEPTSGDGRNLKFAGGRMRIWRGFGADADTSGITFAAYGRSFDLEIEVWRLAITDGVTTAEALLHTVTINQPNGTREWATVNIPAVTLSTNRTAANDIPFLLDIRIRARATSGTAELVMAVAREERPAPTSLPQ